MARRPVHPPLNVFLNGRQTGRLRRASSGAIDFQYDESWLNWKHTFPVSLSLPLREDAYSGAEVVAVFDNLLPDNDDIRRRIAARAKADGTDAYSLLSAIGRDCVGALQFLPEGAEPGKAGAINARPIVDVEIGEMLLDLRNTPLGIDPESDFRISIAGAQDKTALLRVDDEWLLPEASTPTTHILKTQIGQAGDFDMSTSVENEHLCMSILDVLDLPVARTQIVDFDGTRALVVERFDRHWTSDGRLLRVPQEDCCQALSVPPTRKYQSDGGLGINDILSFLKASDDPAADQQLFIKAQIAFWVLGAIDGHAKNFSVFVYPGGGFRLTPLYDVMSAQHLLEGGKIRRNQAKLAMSVGDKNHYRILDIQPRHYLQTLANAGLSKDLALNAFQELTDAMPDAIESTCADLASIVPNELSDSIQAGAHRRLEVLDNWLKYHC